jgi:hypothetical protein
VAKAGKIKCKTRILRNDDGEGIATSVFAALAVLPGLAFFLVERRLKLKASS